MLLPCRSLPQEPSAHRTSSPWGHAPVYSMHITLVPQASGAHPSPASTRNTAPRYGGSTKHQTSCALVGIVVSPHRLVIPNSWAPLTELAYPHAPRRPSGPPECHSSRDGESGDRYDTRSGFPFVCSQWQCISLSAGLQRLVASPVQLLSSGNASSNVDLLSSRACVCSGDLLFSPEFVCLLILAFEKKQLAGGSSDRGIAPHSGGGKVVVGQPLYSLKVRGAEGQSLVTVMGGKSVA